MSWSRVWLTKPSAFACSASIWPPSIWRRRLTSWPSLQTDLRNAGADWVDEEVVVDGNLISSRKPDDLKAFCGKLLDALS